MAYKKDNLSPLCEVSFPANNLIIFSATVRKLENPRDRKSQIIVFATLAPGEQNSNIASDRSYNFNNSISLKFSLNELSAVAAALKYGSLRYNILPYSKFSRQGKVIKRITINQATDKKDPNNIKIGITFTAGEASYFTPLPLCEAYALGAQLELLFESVQKYEFKLQRNRNKQYTKGLNNPNTDKSLEKQYIHNNQRIETPTPQQPSQHNATVNQSQSAIVDDFKNVVNNTLNTNM